MSSENMKNEEKSGIENYTLKTLSESASHDENKKFVIQINRENLDYFESFSTSERNDLINNFLSKKQKFESVNNRKERLFEYTKRLLIVIVTTFLFLPSIYFVINKSVLLTISNYRQTQENFSKLYRKHSLKKRALPRQVTPDDKKIPR